jgi:uncharacterized protein
VSPGSLSDAERGALLGIARASVRHHLGLGPLPELPASGPLCVARGAFVTLRLGGALRGCIGSFQPLVTLARTVAAMAVSAASEDPRFPTVRAAEADDLRYRVSALEPCRPMREPSEIEIGRHGLLVRKGWHRGTLLPVVAVERAWDAATFLKHACLKAGLSPDAWRDPEAQVEIFGAEEFGDPEHA